MPGGGSTSMTKCLNMWGASHLSIGTWTWETACANASFSRSGGNWSIVLGVLLSLGFSRVLSLICCIPWEQEIAHLFLFVPSGFESKGPMISLNSNNLKFIGGLGPLVWEPPVYVSIQWARKLVHVGLIFSWEACCTSGSNMLNPWKFSIGWPIIFPLYSQNSMNSSFVPQFIETSQSSRLDEPVFLLTTILPKSHDITWYLPTQDTFRTKTHHMGHWEDTQKGKVQVSSQEEMTPPFLCSSGTHLDPHCFHTQTSHKTLPYCPWFYLINWP